MAPGDLKTSVQNFHILNKSRSMSKFLLTKSDGRQKGYIRSLIKCNGGGRSFHKILQGSELEKRQ